jgi:hypothetical protein
MGHAHSQRQEVFIMSVTILVCGDRHYTDYTTILEYIRSFTDITIITGGCRGADSLAVLAAQELGFDFRIYPANWSKYGKSAGVRRNQTMIDIEKPVLVIAFHDNISRSKGTVDMLKRARYHGIRTILVSK